MDAQELQRLKELAQAATPGPWYTQDHCADNGEFSHVGIESAEGTEIIGEEVTPTNDDCRFIAAANPAAVLELITLAERAVSPSESVQNLWTLIDAYADAREEYQRSTARHLAKQQRENMDDAKAVLSSAIGAQLTAAREEGARDKDGNHVDDLRGWLDEAREENEVQGVAFHACSVKLKQAEEELAKEKERADRAEAEHEWLLTKLQRAYDALRAARQAPDLSKLQRFSPCKGPVAQMFAYEKGDYVKFANMQTILSQTLQQPNEGCCGHDSDCSIHNVGCPELLGPCDCSLAQPLQQSIPGTPCKDCGSGYPLHDLDCPVAVKAAQSKFCGTPGTGECACAKFHDNPANCERRKEWLALQQEGGKDAARIAWLEFLVKTYGPKSLQYDIEHPTDGLNSIDPAEVERTMRGASDKPQQASTAQGEPLDCATCKGIGQIGGWAGQTPESGGYESVDCPDCTGMPAASTAQAEPAKELKYATDIATAIWRDFYKGAAPDWNPLTDLMGVLSQIDNMTAGMRPKKAPAEAWRDLKWSAGSATDDEQLSMSMFASLEELNAAKAARAAQATPEGAELPPLPTSTYYEASSALWTYTSDQMRDYARAALQAKQAIMTDAQLWDVAYKQGQASQQVAEPAGKIVRDGFGYLHFHASIPWEDIGEGTKLYRAAPPQQVDTGGLPG